MTQFWEWPQSIFRKAVDSVQLTSEFQKVVDHYQKSQVDKASQATNKRESGENAFKDEADALDRERLKRPERWQTHIADAGVAAKSTERTYFASQAVMDCYAMDFVTGKFDTKLKRSIVASVADVVILRNLADASVLKVHSKYSVDIAVAMLFGKRVALPAYLKEVGKF